MSELPDGWEWATLSDVAKWGSGGTPKKGVAGYYDGAIPWAVIGDLNDEVVTECASSITDLALSESSAKLVEPGAILIAMYGSIGKLGVVGVPMATNQAIAFAKPYDVLDSAYLFSYLLSQRNSLNSEGKGATQLNISQTILKAWPIPVPPLPEQRRIVAAIEEHFSRLDAAEADLRAAVERTFALVDAGYQEILRIPGDPVRLASVCDTSSGGTPSRLRPEFYEGSIPWIKSGELDDGVVGETEEKISDEAVKESSAKMFPGNTVLMAMYGATIGKMGRTPDGGATTNQAIAAFFPKGELSDEYLWAVLRAKRRQLKSAGKGGAQPNISQTVLRELEFPLPDRGDQLSAASGARQVEETATMIRDDLKVALRRSQSLRRSVLAAAFSGRLVPQDPADEPASEMLERIAVERAAAKPSRRKQAAS